MAREDDGHERVAQEDDEEAFTKVRMTDIGDTDDGVADYES